MRQTNTLHGSRLLRCQIATSWQIVGSSVRNSKLAKQNGGKSKKKKFDNIVSEPTAIQGFGGKILASHKGTQEQQVVLLAVFFKKRGLLYLLSYQAFSLP